MEALDREGAAALIRISRSEMNAGRSGSEHVEITPFADDPGGYFGNDAFRFVLASIDANVEQKIKRADVVDGEVEAFRQRETASILRTYDDAIGPTMRLLAETLRVCGLNEVSHVQHINQNYTGAPFDIVAMHSSDTLAIPAPRLYGQIALDSRTTDQLQVFTAYLGCGLGQPDVIAMAYRYNSSRGRGTGGDATTHRGRSRSPNPPAVGQDTTPRLRSCLAPP